MSIGMVGLFASYGDLVSSSMGKVRIAETYHYDTKEQASDEARYAKNILACAEVETCVYDHKFGGYRLRIEYNHGKKV